MTKSLIEGISDWLNEGGYPLELHVAKTLRKLKFYCTKSPLFTDIESNKPREIDLLASYSVSNRFKQHLDFKLVIECKKSSKAFVVLCDNSENKRVVDTVVFGNLWVSRRDDVLVSMAFADSRPFATPSLNEVCREGYSLLQAHQPGNADLYGEIHKLSKAWQFEMERTLSDRDNDLRDPKCHFREELKNCFFVHVPVLVVDAPLVEVYLDASGGTTIEPKTIASVKIRRPWEAQDMISPDDFGVSILIITKERVADVARDFRILAKQIINRQTENTRELMRQRTPKPLRKSNRALKKRATTQEKEK